MMQNMLGDNIKNLRIRRKITQEQLAEVLDVSPQAVSRWENNSTSPDISLIPVIADFFDVTCDYLLGAGITRRKKQMEEALERNRALRAEGKTEESIGFLRGMLKEYPMEPCLLSELAGSLYSCYHQSGLPFSGEEMREASREIIALCKNAVKYGDEDFEVWKCRQLMAFTYLKLDETEKAREIADSMPSLWACREILYPRTLSGGEALAAYQNNLIEFSAALQMSFERIRKLGDYTVRQKIEMTETMEKFVLLLMGEEPGLFGDRLYRIARYLMRRYAEIGEHDKALEYLMKCFRYVHSFEECPESAKSSLPWLSEVKADRESMVKHSTQTLYEDLTEYVAKYKLNEYFSDEECQILFSFNEQNDPGEEMPGAEMSGAEG